MYQPYPSPLIRYYRSRHSRPDQPVHEYLVPDHTLYHTERTTLYVVVTMPDGLSFLIHPNIWFSVYRCPMHDLWHLDSERTATRLRL